ncbi:MAG: FtsX-like permease family protein [Geodermatophilaceae bacterium]|nr:FtsX-like permease family protein [Geodermatophilaceae bacterium]
MTLLEPSRPATRRRAPAGTPPRRRSGVLLLPPWTRAPWLSFGQPAVILAVVGAAAILACASSSAALFLSSAASESLRVQLDAECPDAAYPVLQDIGPGRQFGGIITEPLPTDPVPNRAPQEMTEQGLAAPYLVVDSDGSVPMSNGGGNTLTHVLYRDGAQEQIAVLSRVSGEGLLFPAGAAERLNLTAGGTVQFGEAVIPVVGIYDDLFNERLVRPYWCSYTTLFLNEASVDPPPPGLVIATTPEVAGQVSAASSVPFFQTWVSPIETEGLTLSEARLITAQRDRAFDGSGIDNRFGRSGATGLLPEMVDRTTLITEGLRGPVIPIALGGSILALLLVAAAGSYWADRRVREVRLLSSRGVGPVALAGKAALELAIPAIVGTALGWLLARWLIRSLGPSPVVDASAPTQAAVTAGVGLVIGLVLLATVAGLRARGSTERTIGVKRSWASRIPWELILLAAAGASYLQLRRGDGVVIEHSVAQVNLLLVSFPLLFLAGAAVLVVRLLSATLPRLRGRAGRWRAAPYFAVSRIAASRLVSAGLLAMVSMPIGVLVYASALTDTSQFTLAAKAGVVVGSDIAVISVDRPTSSPALDAVGTIVARYPYGEVDGQDVTVLAINPETFTDFAFWDDRFAEVPLEELVAALAVDDGADGINAVAMGISDEHPVVRLGPDDLQLDVVAEAETLPGRRQPDPILMVREADLPEIERSAGRFTEIWSTTDEETVRAALPAEIRVLRVQSTDTVFRVANFLSVTWTFGYLQGLAAFVGAVAIGGLLLYLETRQRTRVASYALARRMGLSPGSHLRSLIIELTVLLGLAFVVGAALAWSAVQVVYRMLEIDPTRPPGPLLTAPTITVIAAAVATLLVALLTAAYAQRAASRADMAEVLRLGS